MARGQIPTFGPQGDVGNVQLQTNIQGGYLNPGRPNVENIGKPLIQLADAGFKMANALVEADVRAGKLADKAALIDAETLWAEYSLNKEMNYRGKTRGLGASKGWAQGSISANKKELAQFLGGSISLKAPPGVDPAAWSTRINNLNAQLQKLRPESAVALQQFVGQQSTAWNANVTRYQISQAEAALAQQLKVKTEQAALAVTIAGPADFASAIFNYAVSINQAHQASGALSVAGGNSNITVDMDTVGKTLAPNEGNPTNAQDRGIITNMSPSKLFSPTNMVAVKKVYFDEFQNKLNGMLTNNDFESARTFLKVYSDFPLSSSHPEASRIVVPVHIQEAMQAKIVDAEKSGYFESAATAVVTQNQGALLADKIEGETDALEAAQALLGKPIKQMVDGVWVDPTPDITEFGRTNITEMTQADVDAVKAKIRAKFGTHNRQQAAVEEQQLTTIMEQYDSILATHNSSNASGAATYPQPNTFKEYQELSISSRQAIDNRWRTLTTGVIGAKGPTVLNSQMIAAAWGQLDPKAKAMVGPGVMAKIIADNVPVSDMGTIGRLWSEWSNVQAGQAKINADFNVKVTGNSNKDALDEFRATLESANAVFKTAVSAGKAKILIAYGSGKTAEERGKAAAILFESAMNAEYMERAARGPNGDLTMDNKDVAALVSEVSRTFNTSIAEDQGSYLGSFFVGYDYGELGSGKYGISQLTSPIDAQRYSALSEKDRTTLKAAQVASFGAWNNKYAMGVVPPSAYLEVASLYAKSTPDAGGANVQASLQGLQLFTGNMHDWIERQASSTLQIGSYFEAAKRNSWNNSTVERRRELIYKMINATVIPTSAKRTRFMSTSGLPLAAPVSGTQRYGDITAVSVYGPSLMVDTTYGGQTLSAQDYINQQARLWAK